MSPHRGKPSLKDYYERPGPLPPRLGPWQGHVGLRLLVLGHNNDRRNNGDDAEIFFEFGMSTEF